MNRVLGTRGEDTSRRIDVDPVADVDIEPRVVHIGGVIRRARQGRFTYEQLATRAGVSTGLISQLERGRGNPSLVTLAKLASALALPMSAFFVGTPPQDHMVVRRGQGKTLKSLPQGAVHEFLTPDYNHGIGMLKARIPPGFSNQERPFCHAGEEVTHVLVGQLEVVVGDQRFLLDEGDTITHESTIPHWWRNLSKKVTELIGAGAPPSF